MIFGETQVTFLPGCPGKKISSKTLISIFFLGEEATPFLSKSQASPF